MVSVCAGANAFEPWAAFFTGAVAGIVYRSMSMLVSRCNIDDAVDAGAVHMGAGMWGVIANSLLNNHDSVFKDNHGISAWDRLAWALCGIIVIEGWAAVWMNMLFFALYRYDMLRVSDEDIETGIDLVEHGECGCEHACTAQLNILCLIIIHSFATADRGHVCRLCCCVMS